MPQALKGYKILIGREPGNSRLVVALEGKGLKKYGFIEQPGTVPETVSRCVPADSTGHASITIDEDGDMVIKNLKPSNTTFVDGVQVLSKHIDTRSRIGLGPTNFAVDLGKILSASKKLLPKQAQAQPKANPQGGQQGGKQEPAPTFSIAHLALVYEQYETQRKKILEKQRNINLMARLPMFFTFGSGVILTLSTVLEWADWVRVVSIVMTAIGFLLMIYSFVMAKNDRSRENLEELDDKLQDHYICPNPQCRKFLGKKKYPRLKKDTRMKCPYCKCNFVE